MTQINRSDATQTVFSLVSISSNALITVLKSQYTSIFLSPLDSLALRTRKVQPLSIMIAPDHELAKKKKQLIDNILSFKREAYVETRDQLSGLNETLQGCRQKTKLKVDTLKEIKSTKKQNLQKYIDSQVQIAFAKADIMVIEENKNSLFGTRENDQHYKRMNVEKKEHELEGALHNYRSGKEEFELKREQIFDECVRVKECSRQVSSMCSSIKDSISWQIRNSTGEGTDRTQYTGRGAREEGRADSAASASRSSTARGPVTRGGSRSTPGEIAEHVSIMRETGGLMAERVLCAREDIQGAFSGYVKIHRGFEPRPSSRHDSEVLGNSSNNVNSGGREPTFGVEAFFGTADAVDDEYDDTRPKSGSEATSAPVEDIGMSGGNQPERVGADGNSGPPVIPIQLSMGAIASMQVRTARSRRDMRGKHIENLGIEKCGDDVLSHCRDEGKLAELRSLKQGLETHIVYQEAMILVARNTLLNKDAIKTEITSKVFNKSTTTTTNVVDTAPETIDHTTDAHAANTSELHGITVTDPDEYTALPSVISRLPSAPPHRPQALIDLSRAKDKDSSIKSTKSTPNASPVPPISRTKRESGALSSDREEGVEDCNGYLATGQRYAVQVREATAETLRDSYNREAALWDILTSGAIKLLPPKVPSPTRHPTASPNTAATTDIDGINTSADTSLSPHWIAGPNVPYYDSSEFYNSFLSSILIQTSSGSNENIFPTSDVPIELAATKLLLLNGSNAKKF